MKHIMKFEEINESILDNDFVKELEKYGKVVTYEEKPDKVIIKITDGFSTNAVKTFELMNKINKKYSKFPNIEKCVTDDNHFEYILRK